MKKILFILFLFLSLGVSAQRHTLQMGQREPTFYYYGQNWIDYCDSGTLNWSAFPNGVSTMVPRTLLRFCNTQDTLKIIGIAAACRIRPPDCADWEVWQARFDPATCYPEYFQLYDCALDRTPIFLAETRWDTAHPRYQVTVPASRYDTFYINGHAFDSLAYYTDTIPIYEAYFDKPITVTDSFYVGGTTQNFMWRYNAELNQYMPQSYYPVEYLGLYKINKNMQPGERAFPCPPTPHQGITYKDFPQLYIHSTGQQYMENYLRIHDTNWHINATNIYSNRWMCIFPIIDTTGMGMDGFVWVNGYGGCDSVRSFYLMYLDGRKAYLYWRGPGDELYGEVSYGPAGTTPAQGTKLNVTSQVICIDSLRPGQEYVAYVRARCPENAKSPWTEGVRFRMPGSGSEVEEASMASRYTDVMPNPTSGQATVISSFTIGRIEVYTAAGQLVQTVQTKGNAVNIDLSALPAGTYLLRIQTSAGDTAKKLTVIKN